MDSIYIAFKKTTTWHKHFLKPGFGQCSVLLPAFEMEWLEVSPTCGILQFNIRTNAQIAKSTKILRVKLNGYHFKGIPIKLFNCVTMLEYMLGKNIHAITPYRLYKKLTGKFKKTFNTEEII